MDLTPAVRRQMPPSQFAGGGTSFPVNDATHARLAISGATRSANAGNISSSKEAHIKAVARHFLSRGKMAGTSAMTPPGNGGGMSAGNK